jgi:iron(III) transport system substrate-binding protein
VVYTSLDRHFSQPILREFSKKTGIQVRAKYDTESTKSVGLANQIRAERDRPRCDVFWNNEIVNTLRLKQEGLLEAFDPAEARNYPESFQDTGDQWYGFAARARVLIVNTDLVSEADTPQSVEDLADPRWKGKTAMAKPLFGTTASHVACLFSTRGIDETRAFLQRLKANDIQIQGGNKGCAQAVAEGRAAFGLTDTDDAMMEKEAGKPVRIVYPDSGPDGAGTLFLPNTVSVIKGAPRPEQAKILANYLLGPEIEEQLANGPSAQIPLNRLVRQDPRVKGPRDVKAMTVDFEAATKLFDQAREIVQEELLD